VASFVEAAVVAVEAAVVAVEAALVGVPVDEVDAELCLLLLPPQAAPMRPRTTTAVMTPSRRNLTPGRPSARSRTR
jgi:hypothetical protein